MKRHTPLLTGHFYHIYNKSIYTYTIFNAHVEYERMQHLMEYYRCANMPLSFSQFAKYKLHQYPDFLSAVAAIKKADHPPLVLIHAYCVMPTHIHFLLEQLLPDGIQIFMQNIQNSYSQFFNRRHNRRGPLWQSRFGNRVISDQEDFNQVYAYIHGNPVKDLGVASAELWPYSSASTPPEGV